MRGYCRESWGSGGGGGLVEDLEGHPGHLILECVEKVGQDGEGAILEILVGCGERCPDDE